MNTIIVHITSGDGPVECCRAVALVADKFEKESVKQGFDISKIDKKTSPVSNAYVSITFRLSGNHLDDFLAKWTGTIQWIASSPFRHNHKRKNWFVGIAVFQVPVCVKWDERDVRFETTRASGPGGQNVNKLETSVRSIHLLTGISVTASDRRTQFENKKLSLERLKAKVDALDTQKMLAVQVEQWLNHKQLERGNPIRVFREPLG